MSSPHKPFWDAETVARYHAGKLPEAEAAALERAAAEDAFLATALAGGAALAPDALESLTKRVEKRVGSTNHWMWGVPVVLGLAALSWWLWSSEPEPSVLPSLASVEHPVESTESLTPASEQPQVVQRSRTDSSVQVTVRRMATTPLEAPETAVEPFSQVERVAEEDMRALQPGLFESQVPTAELQQAASHDVYEIAQYRVVAYGDERTEPLETTPLPGTRSLSPEYSHPSDSEAALNDAQRPASLTYPEALELAVGHFAAGRHRIALWHFEDILKVYPEDVNAQFYAGMSALKMEDFPTARAFLMQATNNAVNAFADPAAFYAAEALYAYGDPAIARTEWLGISQGGGFYADRARKQLGLTD